MRRLLLLLLALALLGACGALEAVLPSAVPTASPLPEMQEITQEIELPASEAVARAVADSQPDGAELSPLPAEDLDFYLTEIYGLEAGMWIDAAVYTGSGVDGREIGVIRLAHMTYDAGPAAEALEEYRQSRLAGFFGYAPEQAALLESARVVSGWSCVALLACTDLEGAVSAFEAAAGEAAVYAPGAGDPVGLAPEETRWMIPFDPPNQYDMSLYDTSAILAAYAAGEEGGLSPKDAAILARCREALAACVAGEMTDFEKELALHDWLVNEVCYDESALENGPPGRPDNSNPYGPLVEGYGICLGYASAFQLLMDLAGVECITVVGAMKENREDHAWNMVRLEGEWYCVDPTCDDPHGNEDIRDEARLAGIQHQYFNITSNAMRSGNRQWDYQNVPEATATRFRWDGRGRLPA